MYYFPQTTHLISLNICFTLFCCSRAYNNNNGALNMLMFIHTYILFFLILNKLLCFILNIVSKPTFICDVSDTHITILKLKKLNKTTNDNKSILTTSNIIYIIIFAKY